MKRVAPKLPSEPALLSDARLPDDVVADQVSRLTAFSLVCGGLWGLGLLMDAVVMPRWFGAPISTAAIVIEAVAVLTAVALFLWVRLSARPPEIKSDAGLWLMVLNAADLALVETWATTPSLDTMGHLSWTAIVILLSAMIMPSTPGKMLVAALISASLSPLGVWFAHLRGVDVPSVGTTLLIYLPSYACAFAAVIPSRMFQRMGRRLRQARDLGSYVLEERLGAGGMGEVWRARHRFLARPAAIKLVRAETLGPASGSRARLARQRFEAEAQVTASLTSPHTVRLYDFGVADDGRFYYVMELLDGFDLAAVVARAGPLPVSRTLHVLRQICHSLAEAHARGLVHRDIKPANVFLGRAGLDADVAKVLDFGLVHVARDGGEDLTHSLDAAAGLVGTPAFMSPEMIRGAGDVDARADLYALGAVAHFLLTGQHVFGGTTMQMLLDHVGTAPAPPSAVAAQPVPPWLDELVLSCLAKDPAQRPASAAAVIAVIDRHAAALPWSNEQAGAWWDTHANTPLVPAKIADDQQVTHAPVLPSPE